MRERKGRAKTVCSCINLRRAANAITEHYDRLLEAGGLTVNQYSLLKNLKRLGVCSTSDLAVHVGLERTTLVRTIKPLFAKGYMEDISPVEARNRQIQVTANGAEVLEVCEPLWEKAQKSVEEKIGAENVPVLMQMLSMLEEM
ncbi:MAG: MarR family winged helix-turn-helix transcriptional regulator [Gracilibacteraceae bacterium]|jgi:DNA-binding MarR family transcriptional regulator|nr:MarR family winged helix-turn-helix transcriptional regulator [Gracilibacteraceae bacterium]